jgi:hypothetical protein
LARKIYLKHGNIYAGVKSIPRLCGMFLMSCPYNSLFSTSVTDTLSVTNEKFDLLGSVFPINNVNRHLVTQAPFS